MIEEFLLYHSEWLLLGVIVLGAVSLLVRQHLHNRAPEHIAHATVVSRRLGTARYHGKWSSGYNHLVTFSLEGAGNLELYVSREEYPLLTEGLQGTLRWQNENLLEFDTDE